MDPYSERKSNLKDYIPENSLKTFVPQVEVKREIKPAPSRYRNEIAKYIVSRDEEKCNMCGICVETCPKDVHIRKRGYKLFVAPASYKCNGPVCEKTDKYCIRKCPQGALSLIRSPMLEALGDYRWSSDMILATWRMAETGETLPDDCDFDYETG